MTADEEIRSVLRQRAQVLPARPKRPLPGSC